MRWEGPNRAERPGYTGNDFKVCYFCGALNVASTRECVICGWHGRFDFDPQSVKRAMEDLQTASAAGNDPFASEDWNLDEYLGLESPRTNKLIRWIKRLFGRE